MPRHCAIFLALAAAYMAGLLPISASCAQSVESARQSKKALDQFKKMDKDGDGKLSKDEFIGARTDRDRAKAEFDRADKTHDRSMSLDEYKSHLKRMADRAARKEAARNPEKKDEEKKTAKRWWSFW
jgi:hypothetical protein